MPQGGEHSRLSRRANTGEPSAIDINTNTREQSRRLPSSSLRNDHAMDTGYQERRMNTSSVRFDSTQSTQSHRITTNVPVTTGAAQRRRTQSTQDFPLRSTRTMTHQTIQQPSPKKNTRMHWLLPVGIGMIAMLVLFIFSSFIGSLFSTYYNNFKYGNPRTYQVNAVVGHGGDSAAHPSHFIAINLNRQAVVIELMAGDPAKSVSYVAPLIIAGDGGDLAPITVDFRDVNGDGKSDMIMHIHLPTQDQVSVYINDGTKFRPENNTDKIHM